MVGVRTEETRHRKEHVNPEQQEDRLGKGKPVFPGPRVSPKLTTLLSLGIYKKPSLSAQPSTLVKNGGKVTLQCCSEVMFETFIFVLHRQKVTKDLLNLSGESYDGGSQDNVSIDPLTPVHAGTYRCYGSLNHQPYVWSEPSDPLDIVITGEC
jgi:hypothetical protein